MPLWNAADKGFIKVIASDSCACSRAQKNAWKEDIRRLPMGLPGSQTLMPAVYTFGVKKGLITIEKMVEMMCENPARIMGLKNKGFIKEGFDADFAVIDPVAQTKVDWKNIMHRSEYSPWQGKTMYGFPVYTILRGKLTVKDGKLVPGAEPRGKYIKRVKPEIL